MRTPFSYASNLCRKQQTLEHVCVSCLLQQVKFYRVDIDEDNIAATVAEAGVASVVPPCCKRLLSRGLSSSRHLRFAVPTELQSRRMPGTTCALFN